MTQITAGYIIYSEQSQPGTFGAPKAEARFDFGVEVGEDYEAIANKAANEARRYVRRLIGLEKPAPAGVAQTMTVPGTATPTVAPVADAGAGPIPGTGPTAEIAKARSRARAPKIETQPAKDAATDLAAAMGTTTSPTTEAAKEADIDPAIAALMGSPTPAARVVTDKELSHDAAEAVKRLQPKLGAEAPKKVTALIYEYTGGPPKGLMSVPADKRVEFLEKLAAL